MISSFLKLFPSTLTNEIYELCFNVKDIVSFFLHFHCWSVPSFCPESFSQCGCPSLRCRWFWACLPKKMQYKWFQLQFLASHFMSIKCIVLFVAKFQQNLHNHFLICVPDLNIPKRLYKGRKPNLSFSELQYLQNKQKIFKRKPFNFRIIKGWKPNN